MSRLPAFACALLAAGALAASAGAQGDVEDVFRDLGTATATEGDDGPPPGQRPGEGTVRGQVFDGESGAPVQGVTVILIWPDPGTGAEPPQEVAVTDAEGFYEFPSVPPQPYKLTFIKSGYRASTMTDFAVAAGEVNRADFPIPPLPTETSGEVLELEEFVVEASTVNEIMASLELRMESDELLNILSAEDLSKFAASDVAEALKRVAGVNVVEGQFAIIRGLEDRYSSTLYNSAPVPSPDPDRQSVQLDLFPSDVVGNLVVFKTFAGDLPSNSSGGSIDIITHTYPEAFQVHFSGGSGFNENAIDRFLDFEGGSPVGQEADAADTIETDFSASFGGRVEVFEGLTVGLKGVGARELDYETAQGFQEGREPLRPLFRIDRIEPVPGSPPDRVFVPTRPGDLSLGELNRSNGRFDFTESTEELQWTGYGGLGLELERAGLHRLDGSVFYTKKTEKSVELRENGFLPNFVDCEADPDRCYTALVDRVLAGEQNFNFPTDFNPARGSGAWFASSARDDLDQDVSRGPLFYTNFNQSRSFERERELLLTQLNGDHEFAAVEGLDLSWAGNWARTTQTEESLGVRYFFEPAAGTPVPTAFPVTLDVLLPDSAPCFDPDDPGVRFDGGRGCFAMNGNGAFFSRNEIEEMQYFGRVDAEYETNLAGWLGVEVRTGGWFERADREVDAEFLPRDGLTADPECGAPCLGSAGSSQFAILGGTPQELGRTIFSVGLNRVADPFAEIDPASEEAPAEIFDGLRQNRNDSKREIDAFHLSSKVTFWDRIDLLGGFRLEELLIQSNNDPFQFEVDPFGNVMPELETDGTQEIFPTKFLFLDRPDDTANGDPLALPADRRFNDELLGLRDADAGIVNLDDAQLAELINGEIDETLFLPSIGIALRPIEGLSLRGVWSKTVARPSFREMGYYVSVEKGTDDQVVGNPLLDLSRVESWDTRLEYTWGEFGDLFAVSGFVKDIEKPIESIVLRNPLFADASNSAFFRTFFNNPNDASLWGIEVEGRKSFDFLAFVPEMEFLQYLSIGGNFTYIDAEVDRTEAELDRSRWFFAEEGQEFVKSVTDQSPIVGETTLAKSRRLFGQPEWIANADLTFDHPDWGTRITLAWFAISDILDVAGVAATESNGNVEDFVLDRYLDSFYQLDLIMSQTVGLDLLPGEREFPASLTFKTSIKNLTDTKRGILYDPEAVRGKIYERRFRVGRDYSFSVKLSFDF